MKKNLLFGILMCTIISCQNEVLTDSVLPNEARQVNESESILVRGVAGSTEIEVPQGTYAEIPQDATEWLAEGVVQTRSASTLVLDLKANTTRQERAAVISLKDEATGITVKTIKLVQTATALAPKDVLIEEVFFTSNVVASTGKPDKAHGDQYIKITNNTNGTLDISGLMIMEAKVNSALDYHYFDSLTVLPNYAPVQTVYCIPDTIGSTLAAGASIIIANNAQNHTISNPNSFDLFDAAFEWYDNSTVSSMQDIDNPTVPNLNIWFTYTKSIWVLHDRGFQGYAIAMPPINMTKAEFLADYKWEGQYKFYNANNATWYTMNISNAYKVPNAWVIDAVNLGVPSVWKRNSFNDSLDQGYTYCGSMDSDPNRYGKSVIRKRVFGKLKDTNNSSNDFIPNATPSLAL